jgi:amidase
MWFMASWSDRPIDRGDGVASELIETSIAELTSRLGTGVTTAVDLVAGYRARIEAVDRNGPALRSVIELGPQVDEQARTSDRNRANGQLTGPLHGIPVLIKDNIATVDGMETTAGSLALVGARPTRAAHVVERLEAAGAVVLGKTNLSEWANFRSRSSSSGWSGRGGQTLNPYALDASPSGSSSGSGSAIAASLGAVALGTETNGSILCPAAASGLVGIKPTVGLTSRAGVIPISSTQDTVGPMARTVADAALVLSVIAGSDPNDPSTSHADQHRVDYLSSLDADGLRGARIGVARSVYWGYSPAADRIAEAALQVMRDQGAEVIDPADIPTALDLAGGWPPKNMDSLTVLLHEFKVGINAWLAANGSDGHAQSLADLIAFNRQHADREMPFFAQELLEMAQATDGLSAPEYTGARERTFRLAREEGIDAVMSAHRLDALVMPTMSPAVKIDLVNGEHHAGASSNPSAIAGYPAITVPAGSAGGLPVGLTFTGLAWSEATLIRLAYAFEQATRARTRPAYAPPGVLPPDQRLRL